jgi:hypothetical protein
MTTIPYFLLHGTSRTCEPYLYLKLAMGPKLRYQRGLTTASLIYD